MSIKEIRNFDYAILLCNKIKDTRAFYADVMLFFRDPEDNVIEIYAEY